VARAEPRASRSVPVAMRVRILAALLLAACADGAPPAGPARATVAGAPAPADLPDVPPAGASVPPPDASAEPEEDRRPKPPPAAGDWLARFDENEQTVRRFRETCANRRTESRSTVVLVPLGKAAERERALEALRDGMKAFFQCDVEIAPGEPLPAGAWNEERGQVDGNAVLRHLENRLPGKALAYMAFCDEDLFSEGLNFVFGVATLRKRCGVYSFARFGPEDEPAFLRRTLKVAWHEAGHILGIEHCVRWECLMNGSNSLSETDRAPLLPCRDCTQKIEWAVGGGKERHLAVGAFLEGRGFPAEAAACRRRAAR
jgi:archaemetzincin